jgi:hypothetical protein
LWKKRGLRASVKRNEARRSQSSFVARSHDNNNNNNNNNNKCTWRSDVRASSMIPNIIIL